MTAAVPPGWPPPDDEPYTGPPPTGPYGAPPYVPGALHGVHSLPATGAAAGPVPWPLGPVPLQPGPHTAPPGTPWGPPPGPPWGGPPAPPWGPPPGLRWQPPPGTPPHDEPVEFLHAMRSRDWHWWRPLLGLLLFTVVYLVATVLVLLVGFATGVFPDPATIDPTDLTDPGLLLVTNVSLIAAIPCVWLAWAVAHGMRIGWSSSVLARLRWRLLLPSTLSALPTLGVGILASVLLGFLFGGWEVTGPVAGYGWLLLVVVLTTPLQSAAEEYVFRGYLSQAIAGWFRNARAGAVTAGVLTAALFSVAHLPPDVWTFLDRFAFGLAASAVVWLTGGLEAAIVLHAVNNVLVFLLAGGLGEGVATAAVPAGTGVIVVAIDLLAMGGYVALVARSRRRLRPATLTAARDLRPPSPWGLPGPLPGVGYGGPRRREAQRDPWGMG
ncbi:CPBP family intramembrane metalloprotease [Geodermatophilus sp. DF01-2]|uniref:CPBP family intramembrane glutamic endopeptidase n=1 Tax=Geodermatophilus sp. DF01-2 TaxID=2559610 RepID=UPI001074089E|nr:CPBP family intramembrane glutamic endopeptidase [Geodermatophilus sp. DF01_2]TFV61740.1 CPBP family intramembrane metalloprotease [Geodermatophilus sp. DF01_2]